MIGFVDDSTGYCNAKTPNDDVSTLFSQMQHDAHLWNTLLWQSGGDLELSKCLYHVCQFYIMTSPTLKYQSLPIPNRAI